MAVKNIGGHGVTNMAGKHHMDARAAQPTFAPGAGMTDSQRSANSGVTAYSGGAKKKGTFPPAR